LIDKKAIKVGSLSI